ncbi:MAG: leucine-rich repeat protein [Clostridia bacterium]|nr:leucine-rich repeat protein [Clostridia bacterium]
MLTYIIVAILVVALVLTGVIILVTHLNKRVTDDNEYKFEVREGCTDFYYSNLSKNQQNMYRMLYKEAEDILYNGQNKSTLGVYRFADYGLSKDETIDVWYAFRYDAPEFFMTANTYVSLADSIEVMISPEFSTIQAREKAMREISDTVEKVRQLMSGVNDNAWKFKIIYDYVMNNTSYMKDENGKDIFNGYTCSIVGALDGDSSTESICQGYAASVSYLCNIFGLECIYVSSGNMNHALNIVKIGERWYYADSTNDDKEYTGYKYFLKGNDGVWLDVIRPNYTIVSKNNLLSFLPKLEYGDYDCVFDNGELTYRMLDRFNCSVVDCDKSVKTVSVPSQIGGMKVCALDGAFKNCVNLTSVEIPDNITTLGNSLFYNCKSLTRFELHNGIKSIGGSAFAGCSNLAEIIMPDSLTSIDGYAFEDCSSLTSIKLPSGLKTIGYWAFSYCSGLTEIVIPDGVTSIGAYAFKDCVNLTSVNIPRGVEILHRNLFSGCGSLISVELHSGITSVENDAFLHCDSLERVYINDLESWCNIEFASLSSNPLYYAQNLYLDGSLLTDLVIPDGVTQLKDYVFYNCRSLTSIKLHNGIAGVGDSAFYGCSNLAGVYISDLESWCSLEFDYSYSNPLNYAGNLYLDGSLLTDLVIPDSVTQLNDYAFYNCRSLTSVELHGGITSVGKSAFKYCRSLTELTIPDGVTIIDDYAFYGCSGLIRVEIPLSVTQIGQEAFSGCHSAVIYCGAVTQPSGWDSYWNLDRRPVVWGVNSSEPAQGELKWSLGDNGEITITGFSGNATEVVIPSTIDGHKVTGIADYAFYNLIGMTSISIPETVTNIGQNSFTGCKNITQATMPTMAISYIFRAIGDGGPIGKGSLDKLVINGGDTIDYSLFYNKTLKIVEIYNIDSIESNTFSGKGITSLKINGVTSIGENAFWKCDIVDLEINNVETIERYAFQHCENLTNLNLSGIGVIEQGAFSFCSSLTSVKLPYGITTISNSAFSKCDSLESIEIPSSVTSIGYRAFEECLKLTSIVIPSSVTSIDKYAFWYCTRLKIYCEAESRPSGWDEDWNVYYINNSTNEVSRRPVQWNYKALNESL